MKTTGRNLIMALGIGALVLACARVQAAPTDGFTQYNNTYNVQNWTSGCGGFADLGGGEFETWVCAGESRVEMRWANWPNQNTANQFVCDAMFDNNTQNTAIHQIKSNTGGEVIYLQVQSPGTLRNDNGSVFLTGMAGTWFHINSIFNPVTGNGLAYINGSLQVTRSYPTTDRAWYFKNGCYNNGLPAGGKSTAWFKNIQSWVQSSSADFSISASPSSQSVTAGNGTTYTATVSALNGFSSSVSFSVSGLPSGASGSFNPTSVTGSGSSTLSVTTTASTAPGTYTLTITGTSGSLVHSTTVSLVVTAPPNFTISATPSSQTVTAGNGTSYTATVSAQNGFSSSVSFSVSGLPSGASGSFNPTSVTGSGSSTLSVTTSTSTTAGTYTLTITGTSGSLVHSTTVTLVVNPPPNPDFSLSASPNSLTITQGANGQSTITVNPISGFTGSVSLSASGLPSGVTASFNPSSTTTTSTLTLTASSTATTGTATVTVTGVSGSLTHTTTISLTVNPANSFAGIFKLQNVASGLVLNNQGSLTNGSAITQWSATSTSSNLDWTFIATTNGYYQIRSSKSGLDAVVQGASTASGAGIIQWSFGSSGDDQWKPVQNSDGSYTFFNLHSGLVLEDPGSSTSTSTQMDQASSNGGANQHWKLLLQ